MSKAWESDSTGSSGLTRRAFVRGALVGLGAAAAGGLLAACSPSTPASSGSAAQPTAASKPAPAATTGAAPAATSASGSTAPTAGSAPAAAPAATAASAAKRGGTLHVVQVSDITPKSVQTNYFPNYAMMGQVTETLIDPDLRNKLNPVGILAEKFEITPDQLTYTFHLRQGVKFHSGKDLTSAAVKANIERVKDPAVASQYRAEALTIKDMQTPDQYTFIATFDQAQPGFVTFSNLAILDPDTFDDAVSGKRIVGTGPFKWDSWTPNDHVSLSRFDGYWNQPLPYLDSIEIRIVPDPQALAVNLESGAAELVILPAYADIPRLRQNPNLVVFANESGSENFYLGADLLQKPLDDKRVRQAINWSLDRKRIVDTALFGLGQPKSVPWGPNNPVWNDAQANFYSLNPDKAKQLMADAGQSAGFDVTLSTNTALEPMRAMAQVIQSNLAAINVRAKIQELEASRWLELLTGSKFRGLWLGPTGVGNFHPYTLLTSPFPFRIKDNASNFQSPAYSAMLDKVRTNDPAKLVPAAKELTDILLDESFVMPYTIQKQPYAMSKKLQGFTDTDFTFQGYPLLGKASFA